MRQFTEYKIGSTLPSGIGDDGDWKVKISVHGDDLPTLADVVRHIVSEEGVHILRGGGFSYSFRMPKEGSNYCHTKDNLSVDVRRKSESDFVVIVRQIV